MKKLLISVCTALFLTACTAETEEMWTDFTEGFRHNPERKPTRVAQGYSGESQASFNKGNTISGNVRHHKQIVRTKTTMIGHQRIDTTQCNDLDDWYLDGFRVGKSFRSQKTEMFQKRIQYCQGKLPNAHRTYWENGYQIGVKS